MKSRFPPYILTSVNLRFSEIKSLINFTWFSTDQTLSQLLEICEIKFFCKRKQN